MFRRREDKDVLGRTKAEVMSSGSGSLSAFGEKDIKDEGRRVDEREQRVSESQGKRGTKGRTVTRLRASHAAA